MPGPYFTASPEGGPGGRLSPGAPFPLSAAPPRLRDPQPLSPPGALPLSQGASWGKTSPGPRNTAGPLGNCAASPSAASLSDLQASSQASSCSRGASLCCVGRWSHIGLPVCTRGERVHESPVQVTTEHASRIDQARAHRETGIV